MNVRGKWQAPMRRLTLVALAAVLGLAVVATGAAQGEATARVEVRVWQDVGDEREIHVSARPADGSWRTLGTIPLPLEDGVSSAGDRYGEFVVDVPLVDWAEPRVVHVRVWQNVHLGSEISIGARPASGLWSTLGRLSLPLDDGFSSSGRYRYGDVAFTVSLPEEQVRTLAGTAGVPGVVDGSGEEARFAKISALEFDHDGSVLVADANRIRRVGLDGRVATIAGVGSCGGRDGPAVLAQFCEPRDIAVARDGTIYVADSGNGLRKITRDGMVTTIDGSPFARGTVWASEDSDESVPIPVWVGGVAFDGAGNLYVLEQRGTEFDGVWGPSIVRYSPSGEVVTDREEVDGWLGFDVDDAGNVYLLNFLDGRTVVSMVDVEGVHSTLFADEHPVPGGVLVSAEGIAVAGDGAIYVANTGRDQIVRLTKDGELLGVVGGSGAGHLDGPPGQALFNLPRGLTVSPDGALVVADQDSSVVRVVDPGARGLEEVSVDLARHVELPRVAGVGVTVFAGFAGRTGVVVGNSRFRDGPADQALFSWPSGIAWDGAGGVIVADGGNHAIRRISPDGVVTTVAGGNGKGERDGPGDEAQFAWPRLIAVTEEGTIYVKGNGFIRRVASDGTVTTVEASRRWRSSVQALARDPDGSSLLLGNSNTAGALLRLSPEGEISVAAGPELGYVRAIAVDDDGDLSVFSSARGTTAIRKIAGNGVVTTLFEDRAGWYGGAFSSVVHGLVVAPDGTLYATDSGLGRVVRITPDGEPSIVVDRTAFEEGSVFRPEGLLLTPEGSLLVVDSGLHAIWKITFGDE